MVHGFPVFARQNLQQILLRFKRLLLMRLGRERQPMRNAIHMRIHRNAFNNAKANIKHDVCRLAPHTRKFYQLVHASRHLAAVVSHNHLSTLHRVLGLAFVKAQRLNDFRHLSHARLRQSLRRRPTFKQCRCYLIHLSIRGLSGEQYRDS